MKRGKIGAILAGLVIVVGAVSVAICTEKVPAGYVGVQYSMSGGISDEVLSQGWHIVSPTKKVSLYSVATEQLFMSADEKEGSKDDDSFDVVCKDGVLNVDFEMSYSFDAEKVPNIFSRYRGMSGDDIINNVIRGKIKTYTNEVTSQFTVLEAHMEKKGELNRMLTEHLRNMLADLGVEVESATLSRTTASAEVEASITKRTTTAQELEAEKQKQEKVALEAETKRIQAQGEADALLIKAQAEAEANKLLEESISDNLIRMKEAEARMEWGWVEVQGATSVITDTRSGE